MLRRIDQSNAITALVVAASLTGIALVLLSTSRYGVGLSADSARYISTARNLLAGNGYMQFDGTPYVSFPPLFPTLLAILGLVGIEPLGAARCLNAVVFGLIILCSARLFFKHVRSRTFALVGLLSIVFSLPLIKVSVMAWTEPLFILLGVAFVLFMPKLLKQHGLPLLILLSSLAGLSCLERYMGVTFIWTGCLLIVCCMSGASLVKRFNYLVGFVILSGTPVVAWLARNYMLRSTLTGGRSASSYTVRQNLFFTADSLAEWFLPSAIPSWIRMTGLGFALSLIVTVTVCLHCRSDKESKVRLSQLRAALAFVLVYSVFLLAVAATVNFDRISYRLLSPMYVPTMLLLFFSVEQGVGLLRPYLKNKALIKIVAIGLCSLWLMLSLSRVCKLVWIKAATGAGGYSTVTWRQSSLMSWLRTHALQGTVYSNAPHALYMLAEIGAQMSPRRNSDIAGFKEHVSSCENNYLVWFTNVHRGYLYDRQELTAALETEEIAAFPDGTVDLLK